MDGLASWLAVGRAGHWRRIAGEFHRNAGDRQSTLGSVAARSVDTGRGGDRGGAGRIGGVLFPGAAGDESGSTGGAPSRVRARIRSRPRPGPWLSDCVAERVKAKYGWFYQIKLLAQND